MDLLKIKALILLHKVIYTREPFYFFNRIQFARSNRGQLYYSVKTSNFDIRVAVLHKYNTAVELLTKPITDHWQCFAI